MILTFGKYVLYLPVSLVIKSCVRLIIFPQYTFGPVSPFGVISEEIQQNARVYQDTIHFFFLVRFMISSVDIFVVAIPRNLLNLVVGLFFDILTI